MKSTTSFQTILFAFFAFIVFLIGVRYFYSGKFHYVFLIWNIFLAWIPFAISKLFSTISAKAKWKQAILFCGWLAFFPNALYIVTDLIHLDIESDIPKWFDAVLVFSSSILGLMLAFVSLFRAEKYLKTIVRKKYQPAIIVSILFLGSFGVYLGRFLRWNSWDIISNPFGLLLSIGHRIIFPFSYLQTWGITVVFTILFYIIYISIKKMPGYLSQANI